MKIIDLKCATIGENLVVRVVTDKGIDGYGQTEINCKFLKPLVPYYKNMILGSDPTDVERTMLRIRNRGGFKPWGKLVSTIEMALWDIAGKNAGLPVYKLLGGKIRDEVLVYKTGYYVHPKMPHQNPVTAKQWGENIVMISELEEGFTMAKLAFAYHGLWIDGQIPNYSYATMDKAHLPPKGIMTERGMNYMIEYVDELKGIIGDKIGLALDCGPGMMPQDALKFAKAMEPYHLMWLEDMITGDYSPHVSAHLYRDLTVSTTTPIHTGEQIYLRENLIELIENQAVNIVGPDPADVGGIAELKRIAEYADLHGIAMAPHGTYDGIFGMAALTHVSATMPQNYIAFEFPQANPLWWYDIVDGLEYPLVKNGHIKVSDNPGLGVWFNVNKATKYLLDEDKDFFM